MSGAPRLVYVALLPRFVLLDLASVAEPLRLANDLAGRTLFDVRYLSPVEGGVESSLGLKLSGVAPLPRRLPPGALLVLVGNATSKQDYATPQAKALVDWLRAQVTTEHWLVTVCSGAFLAARAGLLDGRECTTHHTLCGRLAAEHPRARVQENRIFVRDGSVFTSAGITAGLDLALLLLGELEGSALALEVARELVVYLRRAGADPQLSAWLAHRNHLHPAVHRVQDAVSQAPAKPWTVGRLAELGAVSRRQLDRLFLAHAGVTPRVWRESQGGAPSELRRR